MPSVIIGIHKWNVEHAKVGGRTCWRQRSKARIRSGRIEPALQRAAKASYAIYAEETPAYWSEVLQGRDRARQDGQRRCRSAARPSRISATTSSCSDWLKARRHGTSSVFRATYEGFGRVVQKQYPQLVPSFPPASEAFNTQFLAALKASTPESKPESVAQFTDNTAPIPAENVAAKRNWSIQFDTGKATFTPAALATLEDLYNQVGGQRHVLRRNRRAHRQHRQLRRQPDALGIAGKRRARLPADQSADPVSGESRHRPGVRRQPADCQRTPRRTARR
jgi:OOP family OmpA-OmpF porin